MTSRTVTIGAEQRQALYEVIFDHMSGFDSVLFYTNRGLFDSARERAQDFVQDVRLLEDLGWIRDDHREAFELTMPVDELIAALERLHSDAGSGVQGSMEERRARRLDAETKHRYHVAKEACEGLLIALGARKGGEAI